MVLGTIIPFGWKVVWPYAETGVAPADWTWPTVSATVVLLAGIYVYLGGMFYQRFATEVSDQGVSLPTFKGRRHVAWSEVHRIGVRGPELLLDAPGGVVVVNVLCFSNSKSVAQYIQAHLAPSAGQQNSAA